MRLDRFQRWALVTTAVTYAVIGLGGLVRATGSGLGCPDWPKCFDRWIPPLSVADVPPHIDPALFNFAKAWTEYVNRLVGVSTGLVIFLTLIFAIKDHRGNKRILYPTILAFILVGVEGWIGGRVVKSKLSPPVLTIHLLFAVIIAGLLLYATVHAFSHTFAKTADRPLRRFAIATLVLALIQAGIGADFRGELQLLGQAGIARELWIDNAGTIDIIHRVLAALTGVSVFALYFYAEKRAPNDRRIHWTALISVVLVVLQIACGLALVRFDLPPSMQFFHLWFGVMLLGALMVLVLLVDSERVREDAFGQHVEARPLG
jgi:cytochrome c oxidase assembly protein subunit 15